MAADRGEKSYSCAHKHKLLVLIHQNCKSRSKFCVNEFVLKPHFNLRIIQSKDFWPLSSEAGFLLPTQQCPADHCFHSSAPLESLKELLVPSHRTLNLPSQQEHQGNRPSLCHSVDSLIENVVGCSEHQQFQLFQIWFILVLGQWPVYNTSLAP